MPIADGSFSQCYISWGTVLHWGRGAWILEIWKLALTVPFVNDWQATSMIVKSMIFNQIAHHQQAPASIRIFSGDRALAVFRNKYFKWPCILANICENNLRRLVGEHGKQKWFVKRNILKNICTIELNHRTCQPKKAFMNICVSVSPSSLASFYIFQY